ncbi:glycolate oxidase subunit GlcE [Noviherbaspirillum pedocola]|uniref:Glycolate oxidase subunit GlcE n=1 Tax=Noviherbaspirillum pedocola TaxID=2801341 RepID=A0A934W866_9BURK|nr:glycolate oxidase subunit GlcE [Noviherbaspirillum pedocola]MBK4738252.1 glycolate oxidase subunit GlcE [Noviherbaspirillum pedocola]
MEQELQDFRERILAATKDKPLRIRGGGTKDWYGREPRGELLDTRAYRGVVSYEPTELVITVKSGTPLTEVEAVLAAQNQMLAFEPPHFGEGATVGGMVAAGLSGPSRQAVGAVRDFVLGAVLMDAKGEVLHFGGQVMKNVAGYDVSRLLAGSMGTLGLILEVSLKVLPRPFEETTLRFDLAEGDAIRKLNEWGGQPLPISASVWHEGMLAVRLSGAAAALKGARSRMGGQEAHDEKLWQDLREQRHAFFAAGNGQPLWRLSVPTVAKPLGLPGQTLIEWGGAQRWVHADAADAATIRTSAAKAGGHATLFRGGARDDVFHPLQPAVATIHRRLKNAFDPAGIFNPGRMLQDD